MRAMISVLGLALLLPLTGLAQEGGGLPPFLAKMKRHDVSVLVQRRSDDTLTPVEAGVEVGISIVAGGAKVRDYWAATGADGQAKFSGIPSNPEVQQALQYKVMVDAGGVRFPFVFSGVPVDGSVVQVEVPEVTTDTASVVLSHDFIEMFPDEEALVVRHQMSLINEGTAAVNLGALEGGGLRLPCPPGAKHPSVHDEHDPLVEAVGTDIWYRGALLPRSQPARISVVYTVPYSHPTFEFAQTLPVPSRVGVVVVPKDRQQGHQADFPLTIETQGGLGSVSETETDKGSRFQVLRAEGVTLKAGEPLKFRVSGLPAPSMTPLYLLLVAIIGVIAWVALGFRVKPGEHRLSRAHLVIERDRLIRTLARMRKATERGKLSKVRFEKEQEAITARLVSLYRALDRLDQK
ncbi:MAG: hypothetical protein KC613_01095 [Myxococcales bacterium]|nr:hypothetical protein [Myxococcales bacterium]MCB9522115.1 hypothetical protein [Myxococcales bacterium]